MSELSIFIDESGDFGEYDYRAPYYIIALVMHDQNINIVEDLQTFEQAMSNLGLSNHCIHTGAIIRQEEEYRFMKLADRQKILKRTMTFIRHIDIKYKTVYIEKKHIIDEVEAAGKLSKKIAVFIKENQEYFFSFDKVKIYYDNGQIEVNKILASVFSSLLENVEFRKVIPSDYRLFQVADLVCAMQLLELKMINHALSKSEKYFFVDERTLKKNYLKPLQQKRIE